MPTHGMKSWVKQAIKSLAIKCHLGTSLQRLSRWKWLRRVGGRRVLTTGVVCEIKTFDDWLIFHEIFELKVYDRALTSWLDSCLQSSVATVLDLGGNVGFFSLAAINAWLADGRDPGCLDILSIEPSPRNFEAMTFHRESNTHLGVSWKLVNALAGKREGRETLGAAEGHYAFRVGSSASKGAFCAEYQDLDVSTAGWKEITLLKCDIEGSELEMLRNYPGLLRRTRLFCVEIHGVDQFPLVLDILQQSGFEKTAILSEFGAGGPSGATTTILFQRSQ